MNLVSWAENAASRIGNTFHNDVVAPIQRDVVAPVQQAVQQAPQVFNRDVAQPTANFANRAVAQVNPFDNGRTWQNPYAQNNYSFGHQLLHNGVTRTPQNFINDVAAPVDRWAIKSPVGRGLQTTGLGLLQAGTEGVQGIGGLTDALNHKLGTYSGNSPATRSITNLAKNIDATAKAEHANPLLYHGAQVGANLAAFATPGTAVKVASEVPKLGKAVELAAKGDQAVNDLMKARTAALAEKGIAGRVAAKSLQNIANPAQQAANVAFTALQSGQQIANGRKVTPIDVAKNLAIGGVGFPLAGAAGSELIAKPIAAGLRDVKLIAPSKLNAQDLAHLGNFAQQARSGAIMDPATYKGAVAAAQKAGIDYRNPAQVDALLGAHRSYDVAVQQRKQALQTAKATLDQRNQMLKENQGGYAKIPTGKNDPAPDLHPVQKQFINDYAEMLKQMGEGNGVSVMPDGTRMSNNIRSADTKGAQLTNNDWFNQARTQIESGKAGFGASEAYKELHVPREAPTPKPTAQTPNTTPGKTLQTESRPKESVTAPKLNRTQLTGKALSVPSKSDLQMGKALGMTPEQVKSAKVEQTAGSAPLADRLQPTKASLQTDHGVATGKGSDLPTPQKSSAKSGVSTSRKEVVPSKTKYTTNTTKVNVTEVAHGDYQKVRSNAQLVQSVVHNHAQGVIHAMQKIPKGELKDFWHKVEDPTIHRSPQMQEAITRWKGLSDTVHATSTALGGDTPHLANYARHNWDLSNPEQKALYEELLKQKVGDTNYDPNNFKGLDNKPRAFDTLKQGEALGFKLKNTNPINDVAEYAQKSKSNLKTQAIAKGMTEAEGHLPESAKSETQTIGYKKSIETTPQGVKELRSMFPSAKSTNKALVGYRKLNHGAKQFLLSVSQFHPININMQAAPALALKGHPVRAMRGLIDTAASLNKNYSDKIMQGALHDGTLENGARIGTPVATGNDFSTSGKLDVKAGLGERAIFERQLPAMHVQMIRGVVSDLQKRGISLDSVEARKAGTTINEIMGYVNTEMRNLSPTVQRGLGDVALAPQFTRSKWQVLGDAFTKGGQAGSYARAAVAGKYAAEAAITLAVGAALGQKSDNLKDVLIRTLVHPSIPTPFKDKKGNTIELGLPQNYISEAGNLAGSLNRGTNGRLGISVNPGNIPGNLRNYGQGRLAIVPGDALKVATNTNYADKPLYDPTANLKTQVAQGATTLLSGHLPIGAQGLMYTNPVKSHLPSSVQEVLNAGSPGTNPVLKSVASAFGATARTDKTVGKGQQTTQYYSALDNASKGLNRQEKDAIDLYTGGKKNPVTGTYQIMPNANDARAKATVLLQNPKAIDHLIAMNQTLTKQGQKVDPIWQQSKDKITSYLQYQAMPPSGADKTDWMNKNPWYKPVSNQRSDFFNSLPPGDPNKPKLNIQYPTATPAVQSAMNQYNAITDTTAKGQFLGNHPELIKQWNAQADYNNKMRTALGYSPLKNYPEASSQTQQFMNTYNAADKATRKVIRNNNPQSYQNMIAYYDSLDMYNINKQGAVSQLVGEPDYTSKQAKSIQSVAKDIYKNPDGSYSIIPAGWMNGLSNSSGSGSSKTKVPKTAQGIAAIANAKIKAPKVVNATKLPSIKAVSYKAPVMRKFNYKAPTISVAKGAGAKRVTSGTRVARGKVKNPLI